MAHFWRYFFLHAMRNQPQFLYVRSCRWLHVIRGQGSEQLNVQQMVLLAIYSKCRPRTSHYSSIYTWCLYYCSSDTTNVDVHYDFETTEP